jgi:3-oxoacyl-[acyl-carrier protein] reductase
VKKVAIVCGGTSGIGKAALTLFAERGWATANLARTAVGGKGRHTTHSVDLTDAKAAALAVADVMARHGRVDALVHTVGDIYESLSLDELEWDRWRRTYEVCVGTAVNVVRPLIPHMRKLGGACVFISSVAARRPYHGIADYCAAKAALDNFVLSLAMDEAKHLIRANSLQPAVVDTPLFARSPFTREAAASWHALGRIGTPEEVAALTLYLASDDGSWITGQAIAVEGGMMLPK